MSTRPVDSRPRIAPVAVDERASRVVSRPGPLVARPELDLPHGYDDRAPLDRSRRGRRSSRVGRFVHRYGWRAYAVPLLTVATLVTLGDLALDPTATSPSSVEVTTAPTTAAPTTSAVPVAPAEGEGPPDDTAELDAGPSDAPLPVGAETYVEKGAGTVTVVDVNSPVAGSGPLRRFAVEIEDGIDVDGVAFADAVLATLSDPRSWGNGGRYSFQQVGAAQAAAGEYEFKVALISPGNMDAYCPVDHRRSALRRGHRHLPPLRGQPRGRARARQRAPAMPRPRRRRPGHAAADPGPGRVRQERLAVPLVSRAGRRLRSRWQMLWRDGLDRV